jgi:hypothetical protein
MTDEKTPGPDKERVKLQRFAKRVMFFVTLVKATHQDENFRKGISESTTHFSQTLIDLQNSEREFNDTFSRLCPIAIIKDELDPTRHDPTDTYTSTREELLQKRDLFISNNCAVLRDVTASLLQAVFVNLPEADEHKGEAKELLLELGAPLPPTTKPGSPGSEPPRGPSS